MIIYINGLPWTLIITDEMSDFGECDPNLRAIKIRKNQTKEQTTITFFHEVIHAAWYVSDLEDHTTPNLEETAANRLGETLGGIFCDPRNQEILRRLVSHD